MKSFYIKNKKIGDFKKRFVVVDDFYEDPHGIREVALKENFTANNQYHKGQRTDSRFFVDGTKEIFENLIGAEIENFYSNSQYSNGVFQFCTAEDQLVYHVDGQDWAGAVYLTPYAPYESGTSFYAAKGSRVRHESEFSEALPDPFFGGFYDSTKFDLVDTVGNVFNRLVLWDARLIHAANKYFGKDKNDSRLFHLFFFNLKK
jgi:hypothetical protein